MGTSNQRVRRISSVSAVGLGLLMAGNRNIRGMNSRTFTTPTTANSSDTRDRGRRQWLLVKRKASATSGAAPPTINRKENIAM